MSKAKDDFSCPICLDILKPPIRITNCGHNFCEECLKGLCSSSSQRTRLVCFKNFYLRWADPTTELEVEAITHY